MDNKDQKQMFVYNGKNGLNAAFPVDKFTSQEEIDSRVMEAKIKDEQFGVFKDKYRGFSKDQVLKRESDRIEKEFLNPISMPCGICGTHGSLAINKKSDHGFWATFITGKREYYETICLKCGKTWDYAKGWAPWGVYKDIERKIKMNEKRVSLEKKHRLEEESELYDYYYMEFEKYL